MAATNNPTATPLVIAIIPTSHARHHTRAPGPIEVTLSDCTVYQVETTDNIEFTDDLALPEQPWWDNEGLAKEFANAVQDSLGLPNSDTDDACGPFYGPYFAFAKDKCLRNCPSPSLFKFPKDTTPTGVWAKAAKQTTVPQAHTCYIPNSPPGVCYT